jgi:hypothetical protein
MPAIRWRYLPCQNISTPLAGKQEKYAKKLAFLKISLEGTKKAQPE